MSDAYNDPSGNTAQFRAFVSQPEPTSSRSVPVGLIAIGAVVAVAAVVLAIWALA